VCVPVIVGSERDDGLDDNQCSNDQFNACLLNYCSS
jgi:hypothetical protein